MYEFILKNISAATIEAISATTEEERELYSGDVRWWENKKREFERTHTIGEVND